jgi:TPR repeat protein
MNSKEQNELGMKLFQQKNYEKALLHFLKSEENINSIICLGEMNEKGLGVKKDLIKSFLYFQNAASKGSAYALYKVKFKKLKKIGICYENGRGCENFV